jgi:hypothetical protein
MYVSECHGQFASNRDDVLFLKPGTWRGFHESVNTTTWTVIADDPQLGMQVKSLLDVVDVLCLAIPKEFQCFDLFPEIFDGFILLLKVQLVVQIVNVNDLYSYNVLCSAVFTETYQSKPRIVNYVWILTICTLYQRILFRSVQGTRSLELQCLFSRRGQQPLGTCPLHPGSVCVSYQRRPQRMDPDDLNSCLV